MEEEPHDKDGRNAQSGRIPCFQERSLLSSSCVSSVFVVRPTLRPAYRPSTAGGGRVQLTFTPARRKPRRTPRDDGAVHSARQRQRRERQPARTRRLRPAHRLRAAPAVPHRAAAVGRGVVGAGVGRRPHAHPHRPLEGRDPRRTPRPPHPDVRSPAALRVHGARRVVRRVQRRRVDPRVQRRPRPHAHEAPHLPADPRVARLRPHLRLPHRRARRLCSANSTASRAG